MLYRATHKCFLLTATGEFSPVAVLLPVQQFSYAFRSAPCRPKAAAQNPDLSRYES